MHTIVRPMFSYFLLMLFQRDNEFVAVVDVDRPIPATEQVAVN